MKKVKITVLKTTLDEELAAEYGAEGLGPCPMLREGQVFYADYAKPDGLCDEAWKAIYQYVFALAHGAGEGHNTRRRNSGPTGQSPSGAPSPAGMGPGTGCGMSPPTGPGTRPGS